jgi:outer membrane protein assembly factor BamE (lipoprotein component of BamABCDE complex)
MMNFLNKVFLIFTVSVFIGMLFSSCDDPNAVTNEEFDMKAWKMDRNGCESVRTGMLEDLETIKPKLEGLDEIDLRKILGKPDFAELYSRNQKFYTYYVDASEKCEDANSQNVKNGDRRLVQVRFDAINSVNEIVVTREERNKK